jgi:endonuclease YncB( thermonuclease family)
MATARRILTASAMTRAWTATPAAWLYIASNAPVARSQHGAPPFKPGAASCELTDGEDRTVTRIIDGETLLLDGGSEVRLIGALAPRAFDTAGEATDWPLADRAREALEQLATGRTVRLAFAGRRTDRYARLLAHVFTGSGSDSIWLQGELLKKGLARAYAIQGNTACLAELVAHETVAREQASGLWGEAIYSVRSADDVTSLLRLAGTYQIVEGKVSNAADVRGTLYINFGEDRRQDFTVVVRPQTRRTMVAAGMKPEDLNSRRIRVRGWIERRGGPMIDLPHPDALELLTTGAEDSEPAAPREDASSPTSRRRTRRPPRPDSQ